MGWELVVVLVIGFLIVRWLFSAGKRGSSPSQSAREPTFEPSRPVRTSSSSRNERSAPVGRTDARWHGPGTMALVCGHTVPDGMIYVGHKLGGGTSSYYYNQVAPCFIDAALPIAKGNADVKGERMGYWPSYSEIDPVCRLAYLQFLSSGKKDRDYNIGYVFLYFYGLERRLLVENPSAEETRKLLVEIRRLRSIFSENHSFNRYSRALLDAVEVRRILKTPGALVEWSPDLSNLGQEMTLPLKIAIATRVAKEQPLSFELATAGYLSLPEYAGGSRMRIGATRARGEFLQLLRVRFDKAFPTGFKLRSKKSSKLRLDYKAASKNENIDIAAGTDIKNLPDPIELTWTKMVDLGEEAMDDLAPYARFVGRNPEKADTAEALVLLPSELQERALDDRFSDQAVWLEGLSRPFAMVRFGEIGERFLNRSELDLKQLKAVAEILESMGYGIEPEPLHGAGRPKSDDFVCLFHGGGRPDLRTKPRPAYKLAMGIATLVAGIASSSEAGLGEEEVRWLGWIERRLLLSDVEALRLNAHVRWLAAKRLTMAQVKRAIGAVPIAEREEIAEFAAAVAAADGVIEKAEVAFLEKIYDELGVARQRLYAALHRLASEIAEPATLPVTVHPGASDGTGYKIPPMPAKPKVKKAEAHPIDQRKVQAILADTKSVNELLSSIFTEQGDAAMPVNQAAPVESDSMFAGLDLEHAKLVADLMQSGEWSRAAFDEKARALGLMPDGAMETINEWAMEELDEQLIEGDDTLSINVGLLTADRA